MKNFITSLKIPLLFFLVFLTASAAAAQQEPPAPNEQRQPRRFRGQLQRDDKPKQPSLLRFLNLSREQVQQLRRINQETAAEQREANQNQRRARRALDEAIYADDANEAQVKRLAREFAEAQAAATRVRVEREFRVRQVLTPEQLVRFRELRGRGEQ